MKIKVFRSCVLKCRGGSDSLLLPDSRDSHIPWSVVSSTFKDRSDSLSLYRSDLCFYGYIFFMDAGAVSPLSLLRIIVVIMDPPR